VAIVVGLLWAAAAVAAGEELLALGKALKGTDLVGAVTVGPLIMELELNPQERGRDLIGRAADEELVATSVGRTETAPEVDENDTQLDDEAIG